MLSVAGNQYVSFALEQATAFQGIPITHLFGCDNSNWGSLGDHVRHVMSHLASVHFSLNRAVYFNLVAMHLESSCIFMVGLSGVGELGLLSQKCK